MNTFPAVCPKCNERALHLSPTTTYAWCGICGTKFTWEELKEFWNIDMGDFYDIPKEPYNFTSPNLILYDYSREEQKLIRMLNIEPPWTEIEETLWDVPDAWTIMQSEFRHSPTLMEDAGFGRDGRL